jgi:hypothetical protein
MPNEPPAYDPRSIWQNQKTEPVNMSLQLIRRQARKFQTASRMRVLTLCAMALLLFVAGVWGLAKTHETVPRVGWGLLIAWALYVPYQAHKRIWPRKFAGDAPLTTCVQFYRTELMRRRDYLLHVWRWFLGPLFVGIGVIVVPAVIKALGNPQLLLKAAPFFTLLAIWLVIFFPLRRREQRELQEEIDELDAFQK